MTHDATPPGYEDHLAPRATRTGPNTARRDHHEPPDPLRAPFDRDRQRIIESTAFRRLEYKTQVFAAAHHDHFRTRLTHTLEVAQVARTLAVALRVNEPLAEAIALAHDLGHPPFGHAGEAALDELLRDHGGFNHNAHALRIVEYLEHPFPPFRGLNLTRAVRDGLAVHHSRYDIPAAANDAAHLPTPRIEAQIVSVADRLAYNIHDLEDAIGADFFGFDELETLPLWRSAADPLRRAHPQLPLYAIRRGILDHLLERILLDVVETSRRALAVIPSAKEAAQPSTPLVAPSSFMNEELLRLEDFLHARVYRHPEITAMDQRGRAMIRALFDAYRARPHELPPRFAARIPEQGVERVVGDYIAGMTDRFCAAAHARLTGSGEGSSGTTPRP